ncbi:MAG TPA: tRNA (adenosine(37)-N6)-dimethylallyltransferase MiaA [Candidatus Kapabacteria bacterium]|nr:tRNA (adenosine(37)-N6)-dimethylallyltransferase MiaA [Candidatus Kapabacteria bacterium]
MQNKIVAIIGPTGIGKSNLAVQLSQYANFEIISADSRQIFKYLDIGTAKPTQEELDSLPHHFINFINPSEYYSAGLFAKDAFQAYKAIVSRGNFPLLVGGSGLYIKALIDGFSSSEDSINSDLEANINIRKDLESILIQYGRDFLHNELFKVDPTTAELYPDKNPRRIIRALEYYYITGKLFSDTFNADIQSDFIPFYIGLNTNRDILYNIINDRVNKMWQMGLLDETQTVLNMGYSKELNSLNTVGYKETISYIESLITEQQAIELIKQNTRRYAKRQLTWFKAINNVNWFKTNELDVPTLAEEIKRFYNF